MERRKVYLDSKPWQEALGDYLVQLKKEQALMSRKPEYIPVDQALGRVTAEAVYAVHSSPHYPAVAMDGIAVRSRDTFGASETSPLRLKLGVNAIEVDTGDPLPAGFDAVIMIEDTWKVGEEVEIIASASPWQHVRQVGEDIVASEIILPANHRLRPYDLGAILAGGVTGMAVHPKPRVAVLPTGTEVVPPGQELRPGDIVEYNSRILGGLIQEWGGEAVVFPVTADNRDELEEAVTRALECDLVVINAGSSAGREDYTAAVIEKLGRVFIHGVSIKPGKPVILGTARGKAVLGLPGYPVSAALTAELFLQPLVYALQGMAVPGKTTVKARLARKVYSNLGQEEFVRVNLGKVGEELIAGPLSRGAGLISSLVKADGIVVIPRLSEGLDAGSEVEVELLRPRKEIMNTLVATGSHDLAMDVLANLLGKAYPGQRMASGNVGSLGGLTALKRQEAHLAGIHLLNPETGDYNTSYVQKYLADVPAYLVHLVDRQQGLIVQRGNPLAVKGLNDLARGDITFVNRQRGSGTRVLLDFLMEQEGIEPRQIHGYAHEEFTHLAVAAAVQSGAADAGMGIYSAAKALGLEFVPLNVEKYQLCIPKVHFETEGVRRLLEVIRSGDFQAAVAGLGGYDASEAGKIIWTNF